MYERSVKGINVASRNAERPEKSVHILEYVVVCQEVEGDVFVVLKCASFGLHLYCQSFNKDVSPKGSK